MRSRWQIRGIATVAMLSMAAGTGLALAQAPTTQEGSGAATATTSPSAGTSSTGSGSELSSADKTFIRKAAQGGMAEVELGKLAQQQGSDQAVKDFGQRMVTDHQQANDKLMALAQSMNVQLPTSLDKKDQKELDKLKGLNGAAFDKAYARAMRKDHRMDIREFEHEAKSGKDTQVKQFAETTLPTLKDHLAMAEKLPGASRTASASGTSGTER
jgi:putative membrane protein